MNLKATLAGGLAVAAATLATAMVMPLSDGPDYATIPPPAAEIEQQLKSSHTRLGAAISAAEKHVGGIAAAATTRLGNGPAVIDVTTYANGAAQRVSVDVESGAVTNVRDVPRFPGLPVEGDWTETDSGLKYYDIVVGTGAMPASSQATVTAHFSGYLVNGEQFATTRDGAAQQLPLSQVPPGLAEGISTMRTGGQRKLIIPAEMGFGEAGRGGIPPNATIIFDVELFEDVDYSKVPEVLPGEPVEGEPVTLPSGLMYYEFAEGSGEQPAGPATVVRVHYTGWTNDGNEFDSSYDTPGGQPYQTPLNKVIRGWTEGVGGMKVGGKRKLVIPSELAYGPGGRPGIPPRALLIFDVELVEIVKQ